MKQGGIPDSLEDTTATYKWLCNNFDDGEKITDSEITVLELLKQRDTSINEEEDFPADDFEESHENSKNSGGKNGSYIKGRKGRCGKNFF